jgi:hypothetical protein
MVVLTMATELRAPHPVVTQAMAIMDRVESVAAPVVTAEQLARNTYQQQGLSVSEPVLRQAVMAEAEEADRGRPEMGDAHADDAASLGLMDRMAITLILSGVVAGVFGLGCLLYSTFQPPSASDLVMQLREQLASPSQTTAQVTEWLNHSSDGQRLRKMGDIRVTEDGGRAAVTWNTDSALCQTVVQSVDDDSSVLHFTIDGKTDHVSCQGPSHTIQISPPWRQRL